jgi:D-alanyl-D-alanine endopeptidase (penicillin-binding protein 7)
LSGWPSLRRGAIVQIQRVPAAGIEWRKQGKTHIRKRCKSVTFAHNNTGRLTMRTPLRRRNWLLAVPTCLLTTTLCWSQPLPTGKPEVKSASVLVVDEADSSILYSKQAQKVMPVASITKLMTALVVLEGGQPLDELVEILPVDREHTLASASRLAVGVDLSRGDLLHLALMSSENRAAQAVGRAYPGGLPAFIEAMNAKATALGMKHSRFVDPTGLSSGNVASAADLIKLVVAASREPLIEEYSTSERLVVPVGRQLLEFRNTNSLTSKADWDIALQKTGYTQDAGRCLVMKASIQERPVIIVLLNSFGTLTRVADARRIRRWMESGTQETRMATRSDL